MSLIHATKDGWAGGSRRRYSGGGLSLLVLKVTDAEFSVLIRFLRGSRVLSNFDKGSVGYLHMGRRLTRQASSETG